MHPYSVTFVNCQFYIIFEIQGKVAYIHMHRHKQNSPFNITDSITHAHSRTPAVKNSSPNQITLPVPDEGAMSNISGSLPRTSDLVGKTTELLHCLKY